VGVGVDMAAGVGMGWLVSDIIAAFRSEIMQLDRLDCTLVQKEIGHLVVAALGCNFLGHIHLRGEIGTLHAGVHSAAAAKYVVPRTVA